MAASTDAHRALEPIVAAFGLDLEGVDIRPAGRRTLVRVIVDRDGGVDLDAVAHVSTAISEALDGPDLAVLIPGSFVLEVTSPGVDRPLTATRHWRRAIGRIVEVVLDDGTTVAGRVQDVTSDDVVLLATSDSVVEIAIGHVRRAIVQVEFGPVE
jgi:ribosome maturation factor RimP